MPRFKKHRSTGSIKMALSGAMSRMSEGLGNMTSTLGASASIMFEREKSAIVHQFKSFQNVLKEASEHGTVTSDLVHIASSKPDDYINSEFGDDESTFVLILRRTKFFNEGTNKRAKIMSIHNEILEELTAHGLKCVFLRPTKLVHSFDHHGVVLVGIRHANPVVIFQERQKYKLEQLFKMQTLNEIDVSSISEHEFKRQEALQTKAKQLKLHGDSTLVSDTMTPSNKTEPKITPDSFGLSGTQELQDTATKVEAKTAPNFDGSYNLNRMEAAAKVEEKNPETEEEMDNPEEEDPFPDLDEARAGVKIPPEHLKFNPAKVLFYTERIIRNCLEDMTRNSSLHAVTGNSQIDPNKKNSRITIADMVIYSQSRPQMSYVLNFFPLRDPSVNHKLKHVFLSDLKAFFIGPFKQNFWGNPKPFGRFLDSIRWHFGNDTAVYFVYLFYTLQRFTPLGISSVFVQCFIAISAIVVVEFYNVEENDLLLTRCKYISEAAFGAYILVIWGPLWVRFWGRRLALYRVRWSIRQKQTPVENKHAKYRWVFKKELNSMIREYADGRLITRLIWYPFMGVMCLIIMFVFLWIAVVGVTMFQLPDCKTCKEMMAWTNESYVAALELARTNGTDLPVHPYRDYWPRTNESNLAQLLADQPDFADFVRGWQGVSRKTYDNYQPFDHEPGVCPYLYTKTPEDCTFSSGTIPLGYPYSRFFVPLGGEHRTCWEKQGDLLQGAFVPFLVWTLVAQALAAILMIAVTKLNLFLTHKENWSTKERFDSHYLMREFLTNWVTMFMFNLLFVFVFVRFGSIIYRGLYDKCVEGKHYWGWFFMINYFGFAPGIWYPANDLVVGEWFGMTADFLLIKLMIMVFPFLLSLRRKSTLHKLHEDIEAKLQRVAPELTTPKTTCHKVSPKTSSSGSMPVEPLETPTNRIDTLAIALGTGASDQRKTLRKTVTYRARKFRARSKSTLPDADIPLEEEENVFHWPFVDSLRGNKAVEIISMHENGCFTTRQDHLDITFRACVVLFFACFFPCIVFFSWVFLFVKVIINVCELLYYTSRPLPTPVTLVKTRHWVMKMSLFFSQPFVVFYMCTNTWSMLACKDVYIEKPNMGKLSFGVYFCREHFHEVWSQVDTVHFMAAMILITLSFFMLRVIKHFVKSEPKAVAEYHRMQAMLKLSVLETARIKRVLDPAVYSDLVILFQNARLNGDKLVGDGEGELHLRVIQEIAWEVLWPKREKNKDEKNSSVDKLLDSVPDMPEVGPIPVQDEKVKKHLRNILTLGFDKDGSETVRFPEFVIAFRDLFLDPVHLKTNYNLTPGELRERINNCTTKRAGKDLQKLVKMSIKMKDNLPSMKRHVRRHIMLTQHMTVKRNLDEF